MFPFILPLVALVSSGASAPLTLSEGRAIADSVILPASLKAYLEFIASDALEGRDTPSTGLNAAAEFIAFNLKKFGAKPGGDDGTFFQKIKLSKSKFTAEKCTITLPNGKTLKYSDDFYLTQGLQGEVNGAVIYVPKSPDAETVKGKIVVLGKEASGRAAFEAQRMGALAVFKDSGDSATFIRNQKASTFFGGGFRMDGIGGGQIMRGGIDHSVVEKLADGALLSTETPTNLKGTISIHVETTIETTYTQNVVAIVEGSDPALKNEYVALGAHYDHIGTSENKSKKDTIFNGADDDGSGTVAILGIAEAATRAKNKPKRSLLFVWHCGEEKGLWGSEYFNNNPTVPKGAIVAQLNIDMVGRSKPAGDTNRMNANLTDNNSIYVIGTTMMSTRLGQIVQQTNSGYLKLGYDGRYDDPKDPNQFFYRSDHYNYAKNGIPICFWFDGVHEDYHGLGDEVSKIDFDKMSKVARTVFATAVVVANEANRPAVNMPLDRPGRG